MTFFPRSYFASIKKNFCGKRIEFFFSLSMEKYDIARNIPFEMNAQKDILVKNDKGNEVANKML